MGVCMDKGTGEMCHMCVWGGAHGCVGVEGGYGGEQGLQKSDARGICRGAKQ